MIVIRNFPGLAPSALFKVSMKIMTWKWPQFTDVSSSLSYQLPVLLAQMGVNSDV